MQKHLNLDFLSIKDYLINNHNFTNTQIQIFVNELIEFLNDNFKHITYPKVQFKYVENEYTKNIVKYTTFINSHQIQVLVNEELRKYLLLFLKQIRKYDELNNWLITH